MVSKWFAQCILICVMVYVIRELLKYAFLSIFRGGDLKYFAENHNSESVQKKGLSKTLDTTSNNGVPILLQGTVQ